MEQPRFWYNKVNIGGGIILDARTMIGDTKFDVRVSGILEIDGKVLVTNESDGVKTLPGGAIKTKETTGDAIIREFYEETHLKITVNRLVACIENLFYYGDLPYQQLNFIYEVSLADENQSEIEWHDTVTTEWLIKDSINNQLTPIVLNELIVSERQVFQQIVNQEEK